MSLVQIASRANAAKRTNDVLGGLFSKEELSKKSLTGQPAQPGQLAKPALPGNIVQAIIGKSSPPNYFFLISLICWVFFFSSKNIIQSTIRDLDLKPFVSVACKLDLQVFAPVYIM